MPSKTTMIAGSNNITGYNVISALHSHEHSVFGCDYNPIVAANPANALCQNFYVPPATDEAYVLAIQKLIDDHNPMLIIPSNDSDLRALIGMNKILDSRNVRLNAFGPYTLDLLDKEATSKLFVEFGINTPVVFDVSQEIYGEVVIRQRLVGNGKKFSRIGDVSTLTSAERRNCVVTQYVKGHEYTIDVLCDLDSNPIAVVPRLRHEVRYGMVHFGEVVKDDLIIDRTIDLVRKLKLTGICCIQCIRTHDNVLFFEVNARPGSGLNLTTAAGINMPSLFIKILNGEKIEPTYPNWGLKMVRYFEGYYFK